VAFWRQCASASVCIRRRFSVHSQAQQSIAGREAEGRDGAGCCPAPICVRGRSWWDARISIRLDKSRGWLLRFIGGSGPPRSSRGWFAAAPDMLHDMFVHWSGLRRAQGTKNETLTLQRPTTGAYPRQRRPDGRLGKKRLGNLFKSPPCYHRRHPVFKKWSSSQA